MIIMISHIEDGIEDGIEEIMGSNTNMNTGMVGSIEIRHHHNLNSGIGKTSYRNDPPELDMNGMTTSYDCNISIHIMAGLHDQDRLRHGQNIKTKDVAKGLPQHFLSNRNSALRFGH